MIDVGGLHLAMWIYYIVLLLECVVWMGYGCAFFWPQWMYCCGMALACLVCLLVPSWEAVVWLIVGLLCCAFVWLIDCWFAVLVLVLVHRHKGWYPWGPLEVADPCGNWACRWHPGSAYFVGIWLCG